MKLPQTADAADYERHFHSDAWREAASAICARHGLPRGGLRRSPVGENVIFFAGERFVVKIYAPRRGQHLREAAALEFASTAGLGIETPRVLHAGEWEGWPYIVMTRLSGVAMRDVWPALEGRDRLALVSQLGAALRLLHARAAPMSEPALDRDWGAFLRRQAAECAARQRACGAPPEWVESLPRYVAERLGTLPAAFEPVMLHGDVHPGNVLLAEAGGRWRAAGLFDFGDSLCGFHEYEFVAPGVLMVQGRRELQRELLLSYGYGEAQLDQGLRARLMLLTVLYECSDLRKYALRLAPDALRLTLGELEAAIWTFADG